LSISGVFDPQHGKVIGEPVVSAPAFESALNRKGWAGGDCIQKALGAILAAAAIGRLGETIGVEKKPVARTENLRLLLLFHIREQANWKSLIGKQNRSAGAMLASVKNCTVERFGRAENSHV
jgi:hypothetical protein